MNTLENKVAVITGGGKGIGRACAELFAKHGAKVAIISRTKTELDLVANFIQSNSNQSENLVLAVSGDISVEQEVLAFFNEIETKLGPPDILVNNAAVLKNRLIMEMTTQEWDHVMGVNLRGSFLCSREFFRRCKTNGKKGSIVNISSLAGIRGTDKFPGFSSYTTSKFGVIGLTESLAVEGRSLGIRVNCIAPGAVNTELLKSAAPQLKTQTEPSDIAKSVLFFADENQSAKISGSVLEIYSNS